MPSPILTFREHFSTAPVQKIKYTPPKRHIAVHRVDAALVQAISTHLGITQTSLYTTLLEESIKRILLKEQFKDVTNSLVVFVDHYSEASKSQEYKPCWQSWYYTQRWSEQQEIEQNYNNINLLSTLSSTFMSCKEDSQQLYDLLVYDPDYNYRQVAQQNLNKLADQVHPIQETLQAALTMSRDDFLEFLRAEILRYESCADVFNNLLAKKDNQNQNALHTSEKYRGRALRMLEIVQSRLLKLNPEFRAFLKKDLTSLFAEIESGTPIEKEALRIAEQIADKSVCLLEENYLAGQVTFDELTWYQISVGSHDIETKNFRLSLELDAMLDTLVRVTELPVQTILLMEMSYVLADFLRQSSDFQPIIAQVFNQLCQAQHAASEATASEEDKAKSTPSQIYYRIGRQPNILNTIFSYKIVPHNALSVLESQALLDLKLDTEGGYE